MKRVIALGVPVGRILAELDFGAAAVGAVRGVAAGRLLHLPRGGHGRRTTGAGEAAAEAAAEAGGRQWHVHVKVGQGGGAAAASESGRSCRNVK